MGAVKIWNLKCGTRNAAWDTQPTPMLYAKNFGWITEVYLTYIEAFGTFLSSTTGGGGS